MIKLAAIGAEKRIRRAVGAFVDERFVSQCAMQQTRCVNIARVHIIRDARVIE